MSASPHFSTHNLSNSLVLRCNQLGAFLWRVFHSFLTSHSSIGDVVRVVFKGKHRNKENNAAAAAAAAAAAGDLDAGRSLAGAASTGVQGDKARHCAESDYEVSVLAKWKAAAWPSDWPLSTGERSLGSACGGHQFYDHPQRQLGGREGPAQLLP